MRRLVRYFAGFAVFLACLLSFITISKYHTQRVKVSIRDSIKIDSIRRIQAFALEIKHKKVRGRKYFLCGAVPVGPIGLPDTLNFCGEVIPLEDTAVRNALQYYINYNAMWAGQKCYLQTINQDVLPQVLTVMRKYDVPEDLIYVAFTESSLQNVYSPTGAGVWQLNYNTAITMGLRIDSFIDERYDISKCTEAACKYFIYLDRELDSWIKCLPAYNMGDGAFFNIWNNLEQRTRPYLLLHRMVAPYALKVLSFKIILNNKQCEGLKPKAKIPKKSISTRESIKNLDSFAVKHHLTMAQLKEYNPWLLSNRLPNPLHHLYILSLE